MCGIAGAILTNETYNAIGADGPALLARQLGTAMQARGTDATGIARLTQSGRYKLAKLDVPASQFFSKRKGIGAGSRAFIVHTRAMTKGSPKNPDNNHPIVYGDVIGIHNGWVTNDDEIFKDFNLPRQGQVDSEAIFAAIATIGWQKALETIEGAAAVAWFDTTEDRLHLARQDDFSPLWYAFSNAGDLFFSSTEAATYAALMTVDPLATINDVMDMKVGEEMSMHLITGDIGINTFVPAPPARRYRSYTGWDYNDHMTGWTKWGDGRGEETFQKKSTGDEWISPQEVNELGLMKGDVVIYEPRTEGYEPLVGRLHHVGYQRADVDLWLDDDLILRASLPLARLSFIEREEVKGDDTPKLELVSSVEEPSGLMNTDDYFDDHEVSPLMEEAMAFLAAQNDPGEEV